MISFTRIVFSRGAAVFLALALMAAMLVAQPASTLRGKVLDPSGAAVPKASVIVSGPGGTTKVTETNNDGDYSVAGLPPGKYTVRVTAPGFTLYENAAVDIAAGRPATVDVKLTVEVSKQEVTVADTQQVELDPAKNAGALILKETDLDMLSDDPDDLQAELLALAGPAAGPNGGQIFIDGFSGGQLPPKDSIREIRINSNPFSAEFDQSGRGRIEIFTKPGSEKYHGSLNATYSDWLFNARNPYITSPNFAVPASDTKNLMANFSGPLIKGKLSFFTDFSRRQQREDVIINAVILDPSLNPLQQGFAIIAPNTNTRFSPRFTYQLSPNISLDGRYSIDKSSADNQGVGGTSLPSVASSNSRTNQTINLTETQIVNAATINETRFQYNRNRNDSVGSNPGLVISVGDAFTTGSNFTNNFTNSNMYELQNYTSITHGTQFIKFGIRMRSSIIDTSSTNGFLGSFTFSNINSYQIMRQGIAAKLPFSQIVANGGGPDKFSFAAGNPLINGYQVDAGPFFQDDWRVKPNITLSLGLRYEIQNNIGDHGDWAPRIGLAWGLGPSLGRVRTPKTVVRAGIGYFYDRFNLNNYLTAQRLNGINQVNYGITNPQFFPDAGVPIPSLAALEVPANANAAATYHIDPNFHAHTMLQSALGIDRQLPKNMTLSVNYINSRGTHVQRTVDINTPLLGTYVPPNGLTPALGVYPLGAPGIYNLFEGTGIFKQQQLMFNMNARINAKVSLFGFYVYGHVSTDVNGSPSNPFNFKADYGPAGYDVRHRVNLNGSLVLPYGLRMSPSITFNSAPPYSLVQGFDALGNNSGSTRPAILPAGFSLPAGTPTCTQAIARALKPCIVNSAKFGSFVENPQAVGLSAMAINEFRAFSQFQFNVRLGRTWGFGEPTAPTNNRRGGGDGGPGGRGPGFGQAAGGGGPRGGGGAPGGGGRGGGGPGPGGMGGGESSGKRYTVNASIFVHNLFNNVNQGTPDSNLLSPRLGESLNLQNIGGPGGTAFNRRIDLSLRFSF
jgi:hypothetical protein